MLNKRILPLFLAVCLLLQSLPLSAAALSGVPAAACIEEVCSSTVKGADYFTAATPVHEPNTLYVSGRSSQDAALYRISLVRCAAEPQQVINIFVKPDSSGEFSVRIDTSAGSKAAPQVMDGKGSVMGSTSCYDTMPGYKAVPAMEKGYYRLLITRAVTEEDADLSRWWEGSLNGESGYVWKNAVLQVSGSGNAPCLVRFDDVIDQNAALRQALEKNSETLDSFPGAYVRHLDADLSDTLYVLKDHDDEEGTALTAAQTDYIRSVAQEITAGVANDYEKLRRIYLYVAENFYYDDYAYQSGQYYYRNPYDNLCALRSAADGTNSSGGKVATVCEGYAALVVALARAIDIPARIVNGVHPDGYGDCWSENTDLTAPGHWWAEAWADGRWVTIDANAGSHNHWSRRSLSDSGTWIRGGSSYAGFDLSEEAMSGAYLLLEVEQGSRDAAYLCYENELTQLRQFLDTTDGTASNGEKLDPLYTPEDITTWGTGEENSFIGDGRGRTYQILWGARDLTGTADLSDFKALRYLSLHSNDLTGLRLDGCTSLFYATASYNDLTSFDGSDSPELQTLNLQGNPLTSAVFYAVGKLRTVTAEGGTFALFYDGTAELPLTLYAGNDPEGMTFDGIYDSSGTRLSTERTFSFSPEDTAYRVVFRDNRADRLPTPAVSADHSPWSGAVRLTWPAVEGADSYRIYRADTADGPYEAWYTTTSTTYTNDSAALGSTYYYKVRAICSADETCSSLLSAAACGTRILGCPTGLTSSVSDSTGRISLVWKAVEGADSYTVYRSTEKSGTYLPLQTTTQTSFTDTDCEAGVCYYYKLTANRSDSSALTSLFSSLAYRTARCAQPQLTASLHATSGKPVLQWNAVADAAKYWVYSSVDGTNFTIIATVTDGLRYTHNSALPETTYYYAVRAACSRSENGNSIRSATVSIRCGAAAPLAAPVITLYNKAATGQPRLTWAAVDGAAKYEVWRATGKNGTYYKMYTLQGTGYSNTTAVAGRTYYYKVRAVDAEGTAGPFSTVKSITCDLAQPVISIFTKTASGKPSLSWAAVAGADKYEVYRATTKTGTYYKMYTLTGTSYTNTTAVAGKTYYYKVKAIDTDSSYANSAFSAVKYITCDLAQPTGVSITLSSSGLPKITWNAVDGAEKYEIWRSTTGEAGSFSKMYTQTSTTYTNTTAKAGVTYYYKVRAILPENTNANSAYSAVVSMTAK